MPILPPDVHWERLPHDATCSSTLCLPATHQRIRAAAASSPRKRLPDGHRHNPTHCQIPCCSTCDPVGCSPQTPANFYGSACPSSSRAARSIGLVLRPSVRVQLNFTLSRYTLTRAESSRVPARILCVAVTDDRGQRLTSKHRPITAYTDVSAAASNW